MSGTKTAQPKVELDRTRDALLALGLDHCAEVLGEWSAGGEPWAAGVPAMESSCSGLVRPLFAASGAVNKAPAAAATAPGGLGRPPAGSGAGSRTVAQPPLDSGLHDCPKYLDVRAWAIETHKLPGRPDNGCVNMPEDGGNRER